MLNILGQFQCQLHYIENTYYLKRTGNLKDLFVPAFFKPMLGGFDHDHLASDVGSLTKIAVDLLWDHHIPGASMCLCDF